MSSQNDTDTQMSTRTIENTTQGPNITKNATAPQVNSGEATAHEQAIPEIVTSAHAKTREKIEASEEQKASTDYPTVPPRPSQSHSTETREDEVYDASKRQVVTTGHRKKRTIQEQRSLENTVTQELQDGHPIEAIALRLKISPETIRKIFVKLMQGGNQEQIIVPKYDVVKSGVKIKDLQFLDSTDADFFKVERHPNGVLIKPFSITENENV